MRLGREYSDMSGSTKWWVRQLLHDLLPPVLPYLQLPLFLSRTRAIFVPLYLNLTLSISGAVHSE